MKRNFSLDMQYDWHTVVKRGISKERLDYHLNQREKPKKGMWFLFWTTIFVFLLYYQTGVVINLIGMKPPSFDCDISRL